MSPRPLDDFGIVEPKEGFEPPLHPGNGMILIAVHDPLVWKNGLEPYAMGYTKAVRLLRSHHFHDTCCNSSLLVPLGTEIYRAPAALRRVLDQALPNQNNKRCPEGDSNSHARRRRYLKPVRLPIPPSGHLCISAERGIRTHTLPSCR